MQLTIATGDTLVKATSTPCFFGHLKYVIPPTFPLFFPMGSLNSTPMRFFPSAFPSCTAFPQNLTIPCAPLHSAQYTVMFPFRGSTRGNIDVSVDVPQTENHTHTLVQWGRALLSSCTATLFSLVKFNQGTWWKWRSDLARARYATSTTDTLEPICG